MRGDESIFGTWPRVRYGGYFSQVHAISTGGPRHAMGSTQVAHVHLSSTIEKPPATILSKKPGALVRAVGRCWPQWTL